MEERISWNGPTVRLEKPPANYFPWEDSEDTLFSKAMRNVPRRTIAKSKWSWEVSILYNPGLIVDVVIELGS